MGDRRRIASGQNIFESRQKNWFDLGANEFFMAVRKDFVDRGSARHISTSRTGGKTHEGAQWTLSCMADDDPVVVPPLLGMVRSMPLSALRNRPKKHPHKSTARGCERSITRYARLKERKLNRV